ALAQPAAGNLIKNRTLAGSPLPTKNDDHTLASPLEFGAAVSEIVFASVEHLLGANRVTHNKRIRFDRNKRPQLFWQNILAARKSAHSKPGAQGERDQSNRQRIKPPALPKR